MAKRGGELDFIRQLRSAAGAAYGPVRLGIGDDCAVLRPPRNHDLLVTTDFSLEGRHFRRDWHPSSATGHRCLARGLSDLAAMGAKPMAAFLSLAVPQGMRSTAAGRRWLDGFLNGLLALARATGTQLSGGDTASAPGAEVLADIVLLGSAPRNRALLRSGARPEEGIYVTGMLGGSAAELRALAARPAAFRRARADTTHPHLFPVPRLRVGQALLRRKLATAAIDLSDGLSTDLRHLCEESGVGAEIDAASLPLHPLAAEHAGSALHDALHGGEDYELLFTARAGAKVPPTVAGVRITQIGKTTRGRSVTLCQNGRTRPLAAAGWEHSL